MFWAIWWSDVTLVVGLIGAPRIVYARQTTELEALPLVRSRQNHLLVRPFINGKAAWLTIDTGAPVSAIALHRRDYFRLKPTTAESKLPARVQINGAFNNVAIARELRIGGLKLIDEPVVTVDLAYSSRAARLVHEQEIDGIIGADILFPTQAVLDCERQLLILKMDPDVAGNVPAFNRRGLRAVPIQVSDGFNLYVNGSVNGTPARLMVDTGSFTTLLHRSFVRRMRIATRGTPYSSSAVNLKERGVRVARIRKQSVGSVDIVGKEVGVIDLEGLIHDLPKPIIPIFQKPLITFALDHLIGAGVSRFVVNTHRLPELFQDFFSQNSYSGKSVTLVHEQDLLETGGGIKNVEPFLGNEPFIVYSGDILTDVGLEPLIENHFRAQNHVTLGLRRNTGLGAGVVMRNGRIVAISNEFNPDENFDYANVSVWNPEIFPRITPRQKVSFIPILIKWLSQGGRVGGLVFYMGHWFNSGSRS